MYALMHVCMYACMHLCIYASMHVCLFVCVSVCLSVCKDFSMCIFQPFLKRHVFARNDTGSVATCVDVLICYVCKFMVLI